MGPQVPVADLVTSPAPFVTLLKPCFFSFFTPKKAHKETPSYPDRFGYGDFFCPTRQLEKVINILQKICISSSSKPSIRILGIDKYILQRGKLFTTNFNYLGRRNVIFYIGTTAKRNDKLALDPS